jgi:hypothetical protein
MALDDVYTITRPGQANGTGNIDAQHIEEITGHVEGTLERMSVLAPLIPLRPLRGTSIMRNDAVGQSTLQKITPGNPIDGTVNKFGKNVLHVEYTLEEFAGRTKLVCVHTCELVGAWRTGNSTKLASLLGDEYNTAPGLYTTLVADRNRRWMPQIERMLTGDKNYMIIVGTLHLVGRGGLLELTKARGFQAKQLP